MSSTFHETTATDSVIDTIYSIPDPETFYKTYIRQRQPVHLTAIPPNTASTRDDTVVAAAADAVVPVLLENPVILEYHSFIRILQRIIRTYQQRCENRNNDDDDDDDDDDFIEQYNIVEVNVRSTSAEQNNASSVSTATTAATHKNAVTTMVPTKMPFHEMYQKIFVERNERYYMTTPIIPLMNHELGQPDIMTFITKQILLHYYNCDEDEKDADSKIPHSSPLLSPYIPLRPKLFGNLIPMNVGNVWIGCTSITDNSKAASSGLHHDYHDNLYCLVHGTKIIQLAPPQSIYHMEMMGTLHTLHSNGRIVYREQIEESSSNNINKDGTAVSTICPIRPDGALASVETILQLELRKDEIEAELSKLSSDSNDTSNQRLEQIDLLEEELNGIEEQILDVEMSGGDDDEDNDDDHDDDDESEEEGIFFGKVGNINSSTKETTDTTRSNNTKDDRKQQPKPKRVKYDIPDTKHSQTIKSSETNGLINPLLPPNFVKRYDPSKVTFQTITMQAGDALYIPAGWFHEVTSIGASCSRDKDNRIDQSGTTGTTDDSNDFQNTIGDGIVDATSTGPDGIHMAINYWYHPPDMDDPANNNGSTNDAPNFDHPYISKFWQRDWDQRQLDE